MMSEVTVVVSIGTGIGRGPRKGTQQSPVKFAAFEAAVRDLLERHGVIYVDGARSFGTDEQGGFEGGSTFVAGIREEGTISLKESLAWIAERYEQRCIAVTVGTTVFVGPGEE